MEVVISGNRLVGILKIMIYSVACMLAGACTCSVETNVSFPGICPSMHTTMALTPEFSLKTTSDKLHTDYVRFDKDGEKEFPFTGILRVDGKSYRFMGGDSLRLISLVPLSDDSCGWHGKYSYLYPGADWQKKEYNDSGWKEGVGPFGAEDCHRPYYTVWGGNNIYIRRHFKIDNRDLLKGHQLYLRHICDDQMAVYCNGNYALQTKQLVPKYQCQRLSNEVVDGLKEGDNVLAVYAHNIKDVAFVDFGLYMENNSYNDVDTAFLKRMDVRATQTCYAFQCGEIELHINLVSPALLDRKEIALSPVGFITYKISWEGKKSHDVEILFDLDLEWMFGKSGIEECRGQDMQIVRSDSLYIGTLVKNMDYTYKGGHAIFSQKLNREDEGILVLGYKEKRPVQYEGENLLPYWNKDGKRRIEDLLEYVLANYEILKSDCDRQDYQWNTKAIQKGVSYVSEVIPAYRTFLASHLFVTDKAEHFKCFGDTLGCIREAYQNFPVLQFFERTDWMRGLLDPVFEYCMNAHWGKKYPPYDIGLFPVANRQISVNDCGIEVAAKMLIMTAAVVELEQDFGYADLHWEQLCLWAKYLMEENDGRMEVLLGLRAYHRLIQYKEGK